MHVTNHWNAETATGSQGRAKQIQVVRVDRIDGPLPVDGSEWPFQNQVEQRKRCGQAARFVSELPGSTSPMDRDMLCQVFMPPVVWIDDQDGNMIPGIGQRPGFVLHAQIGWKRVIEHHAYVPAITHQRRP